MALYTDLARTGSFYDSDFFKRTFLHLNSQRNISQFCDVILKVCDTQIYAHSNVLASASPYFGSFLGFGGDYPRAFSQKMPQIIEIHIDTKDGDDGYGEAVSKVIEFMYTSQIALTTSVVGQIIEISKIMQMDTLLNFCSQFQNGEDNNSPSNKWTSTEGLDEVASLMMGTRSKMTRRLDVGTETEEHLFEKLGNTVKTTNQNTTISVDLELPKLDPKTCELESNIINSSEGEVNMETSSFDKQGSDQNVKHDSVIVQDNHANSHSNVNEETNVNCFSKDNDVDLMCSLSNTCKENNPLSQSEGSTEKNADETPNTLKTNDKTGDMDTVTEMLKVNEGKSQEINCLDISDVKNNKKTEAFQFSGESTQPSNMQIQLKDLDEISDLVKFPVPFIKPSFPTSKGMQRGRPRGRVRGRPAGRGRGPGRPRKVVKEEDPDSDPEFDAFLDKLERGDTPYVDKKDSSVKAEDDSKHKQCKSADTESLVTYNSSATRKSSRKRSKPLQLKRDYVVHSLAKKTHKQNDDTNHTDVFKLNQAPLPQLDKTATASVSNVLFMCQKCDFSTDVFKVYRQHLKSHPETDPRLFVCNKPGCSFKTLRSRKFTAHKHKHMEEELICPICETRSDTPEHFLNHQKLHEGPNPYFCTECDSRFPTKPQLLAHKPKHQLEKPFVCAICSAGFKWKHALKNHMVTHSATKDHLCEECGYATAHKTQLNAHMALHTGFTHRCPEPGCSFQATKRQNLKYHMLTHTQEKPHQCEVCGQSFSLLKNMKRHMLLHSGTRPYSCRLCGFSTTRYDKLKEHNIKLHKIPDNKPATSVPVGGHTVYIVNLESQLNLQHVPTDTQLGQFNVVDTPQQNLSGHVDTPQADLPGHIDDHVDASTNVTYATSAETGDDITIAANTPGDDCCLSQKELETIAQLAVIKQEFVPDSEPVGTSETYPLNTAVEMFEDADGNTVRYITHQ